MDDTPCNLLTRWGSVWRQIIELEADRYSMNIAVFGGDGYCGWATALYLSKKGHSVAIIDNFARRQWDYELGVQTLTPIRPLSDRLKVWQELTGHAIELFVGDVTDY